MISIDENIKTLERTVLDQARAEAEKILADASQKADSLRRQAREQAAAEHAQSIAQATLETERLRSQTLAITQMEARSAALEQREKLLQGVFESARQKLPEIPRDPQYGQIAERLLREALLQLGAASATLHVDKATQKHLPSRRLEKISAELKVHVQMGTPLKDRIGVIVETGDGRRQYDNTLETRLQRMQETLRASVYHLLIGASQ